MTHNSTYGSITIGTVATPPSLIKRPDITILGVWRMSATLSNTFLGNPTVVFVKQWIKDNATNNPDPFKNLKIVSEVLRLGFSKSQMDAGVIPARSNELDAENRLQQLIDSNDPVLQEEILIQIEAEDKQRRLDEINSKINSIQTELLRINDWYNGGLISDDEKQLADITFTNQIAFLLSEQAKITGFELDIPPNIEIDPDEVPVEADFDGDLKVEEMAIEQQIPVESIPFIPVQIPIQIPMQQNPIIIDEILSGKGIKIIGGISQSPQTNSKMLLPLIALAVLS